MTKQQIQNLIEKLNPVLYVIGWFINNIIINILLIIIYPFIYLTIWPVGFFNLKTRKVQPYTTESYYCDPLNSFFKSDGPVYAWILGGFIIGLIVFFAFHPIALLYSVITIISLTILGLLITVSLNVYWEKQKNKKQKNEQ